MATYSIKRERSVLPHLCSMREQQHRQATNSDPNPSPSMRASQVQNVFATRHPPHLKKIDRKTNVCWLQRSTEGTKCGDAGHKLCQSDGGLGVMKGCSWRRKRRASCSPSLVRYMRDETPERTGDSCVEDAQLFVLSNLCKGSRRKLECMRVWDGNHACQWLQNEQIQ